VTYYYIFKTISNPFCLAKYRDKNLCILMGQVEKIFKNLPNPLEWRSFCNHDLPLLMDFCEEVREVSIQPQLSEKCSIGRSLLYVIRYLARYHLDFDNSIPARLA